MWQSDNTACGKIDRQQRFARRHARPVAHELRLCGTSEHDDPEALRIRLRVWQHAVTFPSWWHHFGVASVRRADVLDDRPYKLVPRRHPPHEVGEEGAQRAHAVEGRETPRGSHLLLKVRPKGEHLKVSTQVSVRGAADAAKR